MSKGNHSHSPKRSIRVYFSEQEEADVVHTAQRMGLSPSQWIRAIANRNTEWSIMSSVDEHFPDREPEAPEAPEAKEANPHASPFGAPQPDATPWRTYTPRPYPVDRTPLEQPRGEDAPLAREPKPIAAVAAQNRKQRLRAEVRGRADDNTDWLVNGRVPTDKPHVGFHQGEKD